MLLQIKNYNHRKPISLFCFCLFVFSIKPLLLSFAHCGESTCLPPMWRGFKSQLSGAICGLGLLLVLSRERTNNKPSPHMALLLLEVFLQVLLFCRILKIQFCFLEHKDTFEPPLKNLKVPRAFRVNKFIIFFLKKSQFTNTTKYTQLLLPLTLGRRCKFIPPPWYKGVGVWMEPHPGVFEMLQYFETILPLVESL